MSVPFCFAQQDTFQRKRESHNLEQKIFNEQKLALSERHAFHLQSLSDSLTSDTAVKKPVFKKFRMKRSPWLAVGLSALLPGAGQFYNKSYWKVPVILGFVGYFSYEFFHNDKIYRDYRDQYAASQTFENPEGNSDLKFYREFYFNQRNDFVWYFTIIYVINLIDAYVDAHLFDFSVKEDKIERFGIKDREYKLNVKIRF
jgi:hypothetical protein